MPGDLDLALRVRADMREALQGIGALNRSLEGTARRGDHAGAALAGAAGSTQAFTLALGSLGRESESTLDQARDAAEGAFGAMESALTRFVTTGKLSFSGFVDSVIADLARLAARRAITEPLAAFLFGALPGLFGAGAGGADAVRRLQAGVGHQGAIAGQLGGVSRTVPAGVFALAPRFHRGGIAGLQPGEVPIIAQQGETILPRGTQVAAPSIEINFENRGTPQREVSREVRLDPRGMIVTVVTEDLDNGGPASQAHRAPLRAQERRRMSAGGLVWPDYVAVEADGYAVADDPDVARTPFDDGFVRQERRFASALTALSLTVLIASDDDYERFRAWTRDCAHRWFAWTAPESGTVTQARVRGGTGGIEYTALIGGDGRRTWEATLTLEGVNL